MVDARISEIAARSANFGFLVDHEPLLVVYGAESEANLFTSPNTAMMKSRQFGEALVAALMAALDLRIKSDKQSVRLRYLLDQGFLPKQVHRWFDTVRDTGNKATHEGYATQRDALLLVRTCYDLGGWFHRLLTGEAHTPPFVPPQPPTEQTEPESSAEADAFAELQQQLAAYRAELVEMKTEFDAQQGRAAAEAAAQRRANEEILHTVRGQDDLARLVRQLSGQVDDLRRRLDDRAEAPAERSAVGRDELVARAQRASRPPMSEAQVRRTIDRLLESAGWQVQDEAEQNVHAGTGVAVREVTTAAGRADYLLYVTGKLVGVIEAKREGVSLTGVEQQSARYATGLTASQQLAAWRTPLPFRYESAGSETHFTNGLDPVPRARRVFAFHQPETVARWMREADADPDAPTLRARLRRMPALVEEGLRDAQIEAITGLEQSLAADRPRALIQMATGAGKTYTVVTESYRLLKHAGAKRVLFLVDRNNLGRQAKAEFEKYVTAEEHSGFTELYNVQRLTSGVVLDSASVVVATVQRLYSMLRGEPIPVDDDDPDRDDYDVAEAVELEYNPAVPPESFDLVVVDECHRSIYGKWRAVLDYFDAHLVGLTATPVAQTYGFFGGNLVSQYTYRQAVVDGVNVDFQVMRIHTRVGEQGGEIPAHAPVRIMDARTRKERYEQLDTALDYQADQIGRSVMNPSQIEVAIQTYADRWREYFPRRETVPKTLIFAKTDAHADDIVRITREVFQQGNDFCQKITYRADDPAQLLRDFQTSAGLRVVVTVDMIATGTDVKPLECVFFLRGVSSATYFEQMKGRGARTVPPDEFRTVTPDHGAVKSGFLLVDAVGVTDSPLADTTPLQPPSQRNASLEQLLGRAANQGIATDEAAALASRLAALDNQVTEAERAELTEIGGTPLAQLARGLGEATDPDTQDAARESGGPEAARQLVLDAVRPLAEGPELRRRILDIRRSHDLPYDEYTIDELVDVEAKDMAAEAAQSTRDDFRRYLAENRDQIDALVVAFGDLRRDPARVYRQLTDLARQIERPPRRWTPERLWEAYRKLGVAQGNGGRKGVPELVSILRFELGLADELVAYRSLVERNLANWLARQEQAGVRFTADQRWFVDQIALVVANRMHVEDATLDDTPFTDRGGVDGFCAAFGDDRAAEVLAQLNRELPA